MKELKTYHVVQRVGSDEHIIDQGLTWRQAFALFNNLKREKKPLYIVSDEWLSAGDGDMGSYIIMSWEF